MANKQNPDTNLILSEYNGILSDIIPLQYPSIISNETRLKDILISSISKKKPIKNEDNNWSLEENTDDPFINKEYKIDFLREDIIVVRGAKIEKVNVIDKEYKITFSKEPLEDYKYFAVIVAAPRGSTKPTSFSCLNEPNNKPHEANERIFIY